MNQLKKYLGLLWIALGIGAAIYLPYQAVSKLSAETAGTEDMVFWIVIVAIFIPIIIGFILFGYYAFKNEYSEPN